VLLLSVAPPLIVLGSVALVLCRRRTARRRRFRRRPSGGLR
jgi:cytochrome c oxidase assembly factor CtaG